MSLIMVLKKPYLPFNFPTQFFSKQWNFIIKTYLKFLVSFVGKWLENYKNPLIWKLVLFLKEKKKKKKKFTWEIFHVLYREIFHKPFKKNQKY